MQAAQITKFGDVDAIHINTIETPSVPEDALLVEVHAAGVNPIDWKIRSGMIHLPLPLTAGGDFSGIVLDVGKNVHEFRKGDEVFGQSSAYRGGSGSFAEFTIASAKNTAMRPKGTDHIESAALPLAAASALQALTEPMHLARGQKILIHGGSGGIGSIAIQLAQHLGAHVAATASEAGIAYVKNLGAETIIDYRKKAFEDSIQNFDAVLDLVGGETYRKSFRVLKPGGTIVSLLEQPDEELMRKYAVNAMHQFTGVSHERLTEVATLVEQGVISVRIDRIFSLEQTGEALAYLEKGHPKGKVVIKVKG